MYALRSAPDLTEHFKYVRWIVRAESRRGTVNKEDAILQYAIGGAREKLLNANWSGGIGDDFAFFSVIILRRRGADASAVNDRIGRSSIRDANAARADNDDKRQG